VKESQSASLNLAFVVLILSVLGCVCSNSDSRSGQTDNHSDNNAVTSTATPYTLPTLAPSTEAKAPPDIQPPNVSRRIQQGEAIYKRISAHTGLPIFFGWKAGDITIAVPTGDWNGLSKQQQVDLTYYAEHLVGDIKADPVPYVTRWTAYYERIEHPVSGGEYDGLNTTAYLQQVRQLCDSCWSIAIGKAKRDGFYDESTPVSGSTVQDFRADVK